MKPTTLLNMFNQLLQVAGVYILATFLESFLCPIGQNQVILLPHWLNECAAFRPGKYYFLIKRLKLTNVITPAGGKKIWMGYHFMVYHHPSGKKSLPLPFLAGSVSGNH